ncbi:MAG: hypothetical protein ABIF10_03970 [Candidatus Woesearchaeota archaeon]
MVRCWTIIAALTIAAAIALQAGGVPPVAMEIYGNISKNNEAAPISTFINAYDQNDVLCGMFSTVHAGSFGLLSCEGDDPSTAIDEGAVHGEEIKFYANATLAIVYNETMQNATWNESSFRYIRLRMLYCRDGYCDSPENCSTCSSDCGICKFCGNGVCEHEIGETCETCPQDCGLCPLPEGGEAGDDAAGGGAGEGAESEGASESYQTAANQMAYYMAESFCQESYECIEWTKCNPSGLQYRQCEDKNNCGTEKDKPALQQTCQYVPTCNDGIQNCHSMPDGTVSCEEAVDCGGPCEPCASCHDGRQNCHMTELGLQCEEGTDCGGPCEPCKTKPAAKEKPAFVGCGDGLCNDEERCTCPRDCNSFKKSLFFTGISMIAVLSIVHILYLVRGRLQRKIIKPVYLKKLAKSITYYCLGTAYLSVAMIYDYWFCSCKESCTKYAYLPIIFLSFVTALIFYLKHRKIYSEKHGLKRMMKLSTQHDKLLQTLSERETQLLADTEQETSQNIKQLIARDQGALQLDALIALRQLQQKTEQASTLRLQLMKTKLKDLITPDKIKTLEKEMAQLIPQTRELIKNSKKALLVDSQIARLKEIYGKNDAS